MSRPRSGCGMLFVGVLLLGLAVWAVAVALWVLAVAVPLAGLVLAGYFFWQGWEERNAVEVRAAAVAELEALVDDAAGDLADIITRWDLVLVTKGIGTQLEGREDEVHRIHTELIAALGGLRAAQTPVSRAKAVLHADAVRLAAVRQL